MHTFDLDLSVKEVEEALAIMLNGKVPGADRIPEGLLKYSGSYLKKELHTLICTMWQERKAPVDFEVTNITKFTTERMIRASAEIIEESR